jgi:hypothetical protein
MFDSELVTSEALSQITHYLSRDDDLLPLVNACAQSSPLKAMRLAKNCLTYRDCADSDTVLDQAIQVLDTHQPELEAIAIRIAGIRAWEKYDFWPKFKHRTSEVFPVIQQKLRATDQCVREAAVYAWCTFVCSDPVLFNPNDHAHVCSMLNSVDDSPEARLEAKETLSRVVSTCVEERCDFRTCTSFPAEVSDVYCQTLKAIHTAIREEFVIPRRCCDWSIASLIYDLSLSLLGWSDQIQSSGGNMRTLAAFRDELRGILETWYALYVRIESEWRHFDSRCATEEMLQALRADERLAFLYEKREIGSLFPEIPQKTDVRFRSLYYCWLNS